MLVLYLLMVDNTVMAGAQQGVTFALKIKIKNKKVPQVGAQQPFRGVSSFGRALPWHGRGGRFEPDTLHHKYFLSV